MTDDLTPTSLPWRPTPRRQLVWPDTLGGLEEAVADGAVIDGVLTTAGAVVLADDPHLPAAFRLSLDWYRDGVREAFAFTLDPYRRVLSGNLIAQVKALSHQLAGRAPRAPLDLDSARRVLAEVLINAVGHRSWAAAQMAKSIQIKAYTDAIVVWSPGGLPPGVTLLDGWFQGRFSRNPYLMRLLTTAGQARQNGWGSYALPAQARSVGWTVRAAEVDDGLEVRLAVDYGLASLTAREGAAGPEARLDRIVRLLREGGPLGTAELARRLGSKRKTIQADLLRLRAEGVVDSTEPSLRSPKQKWMVR